MCEISNQEGIATIEWTVSGKVSKITREAGSTAPDLEFHYDPMGNRITKIVKPAGQLANPDQWLYTYYNRDAQGNPMAVYSEFSELDPSTQLPVMRFDLTERYIYGSTRIATDTTIVRMEQAAPTGTHHFRRKLGTKHFELTNHLGNVLAVVTDKKIPVDLGTPDGITDGYLPDIASVSDYYPFGMVIPGRSFQGYRYGFNGQEKVDEIVGVGNSYTAEFWQYDTRLGKRWNIDPVDKPWMAPYHAFSNKPIWNSDPDGACDDCPKEAKAKNTATAQQTTPNGDTFIDNQGSGFSFDKTLNAWFRDESLDQTPATATSTQRFTYASDITRPNKTGFQDWSGFSKVMKAYGPSLNRLADIGEKATIGSVYLFSGGTGVLATEFSYLSLGSATADFTTQFWMNGFNINRVNWTSVTANGVFKNPFSSATIGSMFEFTLQDGTKNSILGTKSSVQIATESFIGSLGNMSGGYLARKIQFMGGSSGGEIFDSWLWNTQGNFFSNTTQQVIDSKQ